MKYAVLATSLLMSCALELPGSGPAPIDEVTARDPIVTSPGAAPMDTSSAEPASADPQPSAPPVTITAPSAPSSPSAPPAQPALDAGTDDAEPAAPEPPQPVDAGVFTLSSSAFDDGAGLPSAFTCRGADVSPPLTWSDAPADARSFALVLTSKRASASPTVQWVLWGIPATRSSLPQAVAAGRQPSNVASAQQHARDDDASGGGFTGGFTAGGFAGGGFTAGGFAGGGATFGGTWPGAAGGVPGVPVGVPGVPAAGPDGSDEGQPRYRGPCGSSDKQLEFTLFALESGAPRGASMDIEAVEDWLETREHVIAAASLSATFP